MSKAKLIAAMHAANGCQVKSTTEWLTAAQTFDELRKAFNKVYGTRLPTRQKLGQDLSEWAGKAYGELRLLSVYDSNKKAYRYAVETAAESTARECKQDERQEREDHLALLKEIKENGRALKELTEEEAKKEEARRDAAALGAAASLNIRVMHTVETEAPGSEYVWDSHTNSDGITTKKLLIDPRTGEPVKQNPATVQAPEQKPAEPERPLTRVEEMRARYLKQHKPGVMLEGSNIGGWLNPGGVVGRNISSERINTDPQNAWCYGAGDPNWTKRL